MGFITVSSLQGYGQHVGLDMHGSAREVYTPGARMTCGLRANGVGVAYLGTSLYCALTWHPPKISKSPLHLEGYTKYWQSQLLQINF
jgi:hypothetical protein